ncbi:hypothetical protein BRADI_4g02065v3, partial [Brachypodium distachyon]
KASASTKPLRAVASLPSPNPYPDLYTRRYPARPQVNSLHFSPMQPSSERCSDHHTTRSYKRNLLLLGREIHIFRCVDHVAIGVSTRSVSGTGRT